ncbi:hypothetical protein V1512DRAFT_263129 [Lipomyces arxii]|uniref:uncharacterized protein n=1 Tax=Lipomyces arxii TaxID=56418 RepID=UPI0034CDA217
MSKRQEKAQFDRNMAILKALLKEPGNKFCSDCKRNAYPRWASWNLGVFICIRCSGIHRSMGTHISRVKSVDLDSWTDEQLQNMVRWGNIKANKYWEANLESGHEPVDSKMDNFIRTKYELKRWCAPGPRPDPDTLSDTEREPAEAEKPAPKQAGSATHHHQHHKKYAASPSAISSEQFKLQKPELIGSVTSKPTSSPDVSLQTRTPPGPVNGSTTVRIRAEHHHTQPATKPSDDLLSLDTSSTSSSTTPVPPPVSTAGLRPDLKSSILSLYAQPRKQPQPSPQMAQSFADPVPPQQPAQSDLVNSFQDLSMQQPLDTFSPFAPTPSSSQPQSPFSTLSAPPPAKAADPFAGLVSSNAWSAPSSTGLPSLEQTPTANIIKPAVLLDEDDDSFGSFASPATATTTTTNSFASLDSFANPSFSNPVSLFDTTPAPRPAPKKKDDDMFQNVWN